MRGGGINATTSRQRRDNHGGGTSDKEWESLMALWEANGAERNMVTNDIIGALGMENEADLGRISEGAM